MFQHRQHPDGRGGAAGRGRRTRRPRRAVRMPDRIRGNLLRGEQQRVSSHFKDGVVEMQNFCFLLGECAVTTVLQRCSLVHINKFIDVLNFC